MPLPTARHAVPDVGSARGQGPGADACPHSQISCVLWRSQPEHRQIRACPVREVRRAHLREFPEALATASVAQQTYGRCTRQRQIPPRHTTGAVAPEISQDPHVALSAAIQSPTGTHRARLEVGSPHGDPQSLLRNLARTPCSGRTMLRPLANIEFSAT